VAINVTVARARIFPNYKMNKMSVYAQDQRENAPRLSSFPFSSDFYRQNRLSSAIFGISREESRYFPFIELPKREAEWLTDPGVQQFFLPIPALPPLISFPLAAVLSYVPP